MAALKKKQHTPHPNKSIIFTRSHISAPFITAAKKSGIKKGKKHTFSRASREADHKPAAPAPLTFIQRNLCPAHLMR